MDTVGAYEAKTHLSKLLERVSRGESFTITKHGMPIAVLKPPEIARKRSPREAIEEIKRIGARNSLGGLTIREMIEEGRD